MHVIRIAFEKAQACIRQEHSCLVLIRMHNFVHDETQIGYAVQIEVIRDQDGFLGDHVKTADVRLVLGHPGGRTEGFHDCFLWDALDADWG